MLIANDKNKSTRRILFIGTAILTICLFTCLANVAGVKTALMDKSKESFSNVIQTSERILAKNLESSRDIVLITANLLSNDELATKQTDIYSTLKEKQDSSDFDFFLFRSLTGSFYSEEGLASDIVDEYNFAWLTETEKSYWGLVNISNTEEAHYVVAFVEPVYSGNAKIGNVVAVKDFSSFLSDKSLDKIYEYGQCYITDNNGEVINASSYSKSYIDNNKNVYDGLINYAKHSSAERLSIRNFESAMANKASDEMTFMSYEGNIYRIEYSQVSNLRGLYFVCFYDESALEAEISPVVASSAFTCIITIILMIALISYVWVSSKRANDTIERIAYSDEITRGKNLNYFKNRAVSLMQSNMETPYLVQRFDIANFRYINEAYGHNRADEILKGCIELSKTHFLEKEICVRMNADQFIVFSENNEGVDRRRDSYIRALNEYARSIGVKYPIRLKFGIYQVRKHDKDIDVIIDRANVARKSLKSDDKSLMAYYSDSLVTEMRKSDKIESEMQKALDTGEFNLYFQPKWDIVANKLSGAEVLVRWIKPDGSIIYPDSFISIFEKNGFIEKLDFYMLETVCKKMKKLMDLGVEICPISINQSRILLNNPDYVNIVERILQRNSLPKEFVELELTETVFMNEQEKMKEVMNKLRKLEISLSMDDFGSGYSSLNILKDIPFNILKIDRVFFSESITSESSTWILQKIIEMAEGLGIHVVCEGVETLEQVELLRRIGCRYVQGYYYSRPIPYIEFIQKYLGATDEISETVRQYH